MISKTFVNLFIALNFDHSIMHSKICSLLTISVNTDQAQISLSSRNSTSIFSVAILLLWGHPSKKDTLFLKWINVYSRQYFSTLTMISTKGLALWVNSFQIFSNNSPLWQLELSNNFLNSFLLNKQNVNLFFFWLSLLNCHAVNIIRVKDKKCLLSHN